MPQPTHLDYAKLSHAVYSQNPAESIGNWNKVKFEAADQNQSDFQAVAYQHQSLDFLVIAFRGTKTLKNWYENTQLASSGHFSQKLLDLVYKFVGDLQFAFPALFNAKNVMVTGHSAGGCLTEYCAFKGIAFESPSFTSNSEQQNYLTSNVIHYFTRPNAVNTLYPHYGDIYSVPLLINDLSYETGLNLYVLQQHSMDNIVKAFQDQVTPPHARKIKKWPIYGNQNALGFVLNIWLKHCDLETAFLGHQNEYDEPDKRGIQHLQNANARIEALIEFLIDNPKAVSSEDIYIRLAYKFYKMNSFDRSNAIAKKSWEIFVGNNAEIFSEQRAQKKIHDCFYFLIELTDMINEIQNKSSSALLSRLLNDNGFFQEFSNKIKNISNYRDIIKNNSLYLLKI